MASVAIPVPRDSVPRLKQNWVISPVWDMLLIVAAPPIALLWGTWTSKHLGPEVVLVTFAIFTIAHHLPTFIRIYGDLDLLRRFRWSLLLGPVVPFSLSMLLMASAIAGGQKLENLLFLTIILSLWDPWHFLMQHYGFMRIYDRPNTALRGVGARMDLSISAIWYATILLAAVQWLPDLLYRFQCDHGIPVLPIFSAGVYPFLERFFLAGAVLMSGVYLGYVAWCYSRGHFISWVKLLMLVTTFGVMYLAYVPNRVMANWQPEWNFAVGYATVNMVHVTQYLAIVWQYNRNLVRRPERGRAGAFSRFFARSGILVASFYVGVCLLYGFILSQPGQKAAGALVGSLPGSDGPNHAMLWYMAIIISVGFTSNLLHYYYDGFIWKVRHREVRENLYLERDVTGQAQQGPSWWDSRSPMASAFDTLLKHTVYFGLPIAFLALSFVLVSATTTRTPLQELRRAVEARGPSSTDQRQSELARAVAAADRQLEIERRMLEIRPRAKHYAYLAQLTYWRSLAQKALASNKDPASVLEERRSAELQHAIAAQEKALEYPGPYSHREAKSLTREAMEQIIAKWRRESESG